jgi:hypothetical protein
MASEARKTNMPNLGRVNRGPADGVGYEWEAGSVVVLIAKTI